MVRRIRRKSIFDWGKSDASVLCGTTVAALVTSCGLLGDLKEVPNPADSVVLSNHPADAGDAATVDTAPFDAAPISDRPMPDAAATSAEVTSNSTAATIDAPDAGSKQTASTSDTREASTPPSSDPIEPSFPDAGTELPDDAGGNALTDSGYESSRSDHLIGSNSFAPEDSGADSEAVDQTSAPACGIPQPNGAPLCDPVAQCGCGEGQNCAYTPGRQRRFTCVAPGPTATQDACELDDECSLGSVCTNGLCLATCADNEDCPEDTQCKEISTEAGSEPDIHVCTKPCDPLDVASCGQGATCTVTSGTQPTCVRQTATEGGDEAACDSDTDCDHGYGCTSDGVCRAWCSLESDDAGLEAGPASNGCKAHSTCEPTANDLGLGQCSAQCPVPDVAGSECSILPTSCGCSEGTTCHAEPLGKTTCDTPGPNGYMTWCDKNSQCAAGFSCLANLCRPVCDDAAAPCEDGSVCTKTLTSEDSPSACLGHCNPLAPDSSTSAFTACGAGAYCSPGFKIESVRPESHCLRGTDARPKLSGESCVLDTDCSNGLGCDISSQTCRAWCTVNEDCTQGSCITTGSARTRNADETLGFCH